MTNYLSEAFKMMEGLEDTFSFDETGVKELKKFKDEDVTEEEVSIIDADATTEEDLEDSYKDKIIIQCNTCTSLIYKNKEDIVIDEESKDANVEEECPYCMATTGFKIIGQIVPYTGEEVEEEETTETEETTEVTEEEPEEDFIPEEDEEEVVVEEGLKVVHDGDDYKLVKESKNAIKEDFNKVDIETDREKMSMTADETGKVTVTTEPVENAMGEVESGEETIAPVSDEVKVDIESSNEEDEEETFEPETEEDLGVEDVDIDEFEESDFDELGESYLKKVYENVESYKTTSGTISDSKLKLEGVITFKSGKQANTNFIFESKYKTKSGKLKLIGENLQIANKKNAFTLTGKADGKKLCVESFTYNYNGKDSKTGKVSRLYGTIKK